MNRKGIMITAGVGLFLTILLANTLITGQSKEDRDEYWPSNNKADNKTTGPTLSSQQAKAQQRVEEAQAALTLAEQEFDQLEFELAEAERYVESLELKGENPADNAEEGMLLLRPVIEKYEAKLAIIESAEQQLLGAQEELKKLQSENVQSTE